MTPSTTRSQAAAKSIFGDNERGIWLTEDETAALIASHYAELEAAAVLARDALKVAMPYVIWCDPEGRLPSEYPEAAAIVDNNAETVKAALSALAAVLGKEQTT